MRQCDLSARKLDDGNYLHRCSVCGWSLIREAIIPDLQRNCPGPTDATLIDRGPCQCPAAGWCERHQMRKSKAVHKVCINSSEQRAVWDYVAEHGKSPYGERPGMMRLIGNFSLALIKHMAGGGVHATDQQIQARMDICQTCPSRRFDGTVCVHPSCGCRISRTRMASKLAWASESCPDGHWGAIDQ